MDYRSVEDPRIRIRIKVQKLAMKDLPGAFETRPGAVEGPVELQRAFRPPDS
jgi:hypothetical protein